MRKTRSKCIFCPLQRITITMKLTNPDIFSAEYPLRRIILLIKVLMEKTIPFWRKQKKLNVKKILIYCIFGQPAFNFEALTSPQL